MAVASSHASWQRYEAKYVVDPQLATRVRSVCRRSLPPDPHSATQPNGEYPIHSLYLDSRDRMLARSVVERRSVRFKLRVRRYRGLHETAPELPSYVEIKRKSFGIVRKTRAKLAARESERLLRNPVTSQIPADAEPRLAENLNEFLDLQNQMGAHPVIAVFY